MICEHCKAPMQTYAIDCAECGRTVYPVLAAPPERYVCRLCRSGAAEARREAASKGGAARAAQRRLHEPARASS
jgi:hypothetical protein